MLNRTTDMNMKDMNQRGRFFRERFHLKLLSVSTTIVAVVLCVHLFTNSTTPASTKVAQHTSEEFALDNKTVCVPLPEKLDFCGEQVPLDRPEVVEALDRELLVNAYWHSQTILFFKRANRYYPLIEKYLKENNLPDDFKYLCTIESSLMPRAISPAGAAGFWQILAKTGTELGLEVNDEVDERYHLEKSTRAAAQYLKKSHQRYASWTIAAASYNAGMNGINRQATRQKMESYYDLLFGEETGRYVYRILAIKTIMNNPEAYGYFIAPEEKYLPVKTIEYTVSEPIADIAEFAIQHGTTYKVLKDLNPWLRQNTLTNKNRKSYTLLLPESSEKLKNQE